MAKVFIGNIKGKNGDNGNGIASITTNQSAIPGAYNTITINMTDGRSESFNVRNGSNGLNGSQGLAGADATINGFNTLTLEAKGGIAATQDGDKLTLSSAYSVGKNILDNAYFLNLVNQRGQQLYTEPGYAVDRWRIATTGTNVEVRSNGLAIIGLETGTENYTAVRQPIAYPEKLYGKTITVSMLLSDGSLVWKTGTVPTTAPTTGTTPVAVAQLSSDWYAALLLNSAGALLFQMRGSKPGEMTIAAVKLELGDTQTLAHQDADGNWALNEIPDYTEELVKCQRYQYALFEKTTDQMLGNAIAISASQAQIIVPIPSVLRHEDIEIERSDVSHFCLVDASQIYPLKNISLISVSNGTALMLATTSGLTAGKPYFFAVSTDTGDAKFILNANL